MWKIRFKEQHQKAARLLEEAAGRTNNEKLKNYLNLRAEALREDE